MKIKDIALEVQNQIRNENPDMNDAEIKALFDALSVEEHKERLATLSTIIIASGDDSDPVAKAELTAKFLAAWIASRKKDEGPEVEKKWFTAELSISEVIKSADSRSPVEDARKEMDFNKVLIAREALKSLHLGIATDDINVFEPAYPFARITVGFHRKGQPFMRNGVPDKYAHTGWYLKAIDKIEKFDYVLPKADAIISKRLGTVTDPEVKGRLIREMIALEREVNQ